MLDLTDNEIRDIGKYLEDGKPLPEKYRFLLFEESIEVELLWYGKTNEVSNAVLPFQVIEQVDEPRAEKEAKLQLDIFNLDARGRQSGGWTNKLIWGDNKLILSSLRGGPLRQEIEDEGGIKLIYIDPPFDVGADFSMDIQIGDEQLTKEPSVLEELAYRDTWGKGADSFISMIYERLYLMRDLLAEDGSIFVHCDWRVNSYLRLVLDELFGVGNFKNEIIWLRTRAQHTDAKSFGNVHDSIFYYSKSERYSYFPQYTDHKPEYIARFSKVDKNGRKYMLIPAHGAGAGPARSFGEKGAIAPPRGRHWAYSQEKINQLIEQDLIEFTSNGTPSLRHYLDVSKGAVSQSIWADIAPLNPVAQERLEYPTQKPEALIQRIINASTKQGDLIADFFVGSGTTLAAAEKLDRKWIGADLGKFSVHTTRKRLIEVQRQLKKEGKQFRAFELLNLGKYERQHYIGVNPDLKDEDKAKQIAKKENDFTRLIINSYRADPIEGFRTFSGRKNSRLVAVGPINMPVSRLFVEEVVKECVDKKITKADILAFEFEMGLFPHVQEEAKDRGVDLVLKYIPPDVFDKRAVEKNQVIFYDVSYIEIKPHVKNGSVAIELTDFSVFYNQDTIANVESTLREGGSKVIVENGQIIKVSKDKESGIIEKEVLTKKWTDWIDYWSVDFNFESKKEVIRVLKDSESNKKEYEEVWTGDFIFENEWQSFRTKRDRSLELTSIFHECPKGRRKLAVKVVDIFGNDTMKVIEVTV